MKLQMPRRIIAGFLLAIVISSAAGILIYRVAMRFRENRNHVQRSDQVLGVLQDLSAALDRAESTTRVYVITGDDSYIPQYENALTEVRGSVGSLQSLVADNPKQRELLDQLKPHLAHGRQVMESLVQMRRTQGLEAVLMSVDPAANRRELETIQGLIGSMRDQEHAVLEQRRQQYDASVRRTSALFAAGIVTQCILLLLICIVFWRDAAYRERAAREIENTNIKLATILATTGDGIYQLDRAGRVLFLNPAGERMLGYSLHEIRGKMMHDLIHSRTPQGEHRPAESCALQTAMRKGVPVTSPEEWYQRKDGSFLTVQCTSVPLCIEGEITGAVFSFHDITDRRRREELLRSTTELQRAMFDSANVSIISTDANGMITTFNAAAERMLQYPAEEMVGKNTPALIHDQGEVRLRAAELTKELGITVAPGFDSFAAKTMRTGVPDEREWTYVRKDGSRFPVYLSVTALRAANGAINGFLGIAEDITERKKAEAALRDSEAKLRKALQREKNVARVDFLTGILNRRGFYEIAGTESQRSRRYKRPLSLVYVDLDNFKAVNDSLGHESGDELLVHVAATIQSAVRGTDVVARLGGDEFSVLLPETDQENGMVVVEKVRKQLLEAMQERNWPVTFSVGVTSFRSAPESVDEMIREADRVMYSVKLKGKNSVAMHAIG
jgi:diguanylate cyclase (GGDEF)-like protein/PAS domain S-box-containing protein